MEMTFAPTKKLTKVWRLVEKEKKSLGYERQDGQEKRRREREMRKQKGREREAGAEKKEKLKKSKEGREEAENYIVFSLTRSPISLASLCQSHNRISFPSGPIKVPQEKKNEKQSEQQCLFIYSFHLYLISTVALVALAASPKQQTTKFREQESVPK